MRQKWSELVVFGVGCVGLAGCQSAQPPVAEPTQTRATTPRASGQVSVATTAAPSPPANKPRHYERPPVDQDETAGVRGTQFVDFIVTENGKLVKGALVTVVNARGKTEGIGKTTDWGEFHTALATGKYKVKVEREASSMVKSVTVVAGTSQVDLKIDGSK